MVRERAAPASTTPVNHGGVTRFRALAAREVRRRTRHFWRVRRTAPVADRAAEGQGRARRLCAAAARRRRAPVRTSRTPQPVTRTKASRTIGQRHLGLAGAAVDEGDGDLDHPAALVDEAVGHLDLEAVAVGPHVAEVDPPEGVGPVGPVAGRRVVHGQAQRQRGVPVAPARQERPPPGPVRRGAAGHVPRPDGDVGPVRGRRDQRGQRQRVVGEVGVHLDEDVEAPLEPLGEAGEVGAAQAVLGRAPQQRDAGIGGPGGLDELGRPVRAVVVDDEDLPVGQHLADAPQRRLDAGGLVVGGDDHQRAHPGEHRSGSGRPP